MVHNFTIKYRFYYFLGRIEMLYECITRCSELDYDNEPHCQCENIDDFYKLFGNDCPCGNIPVWKKIKRE